MPDLRYRLPNEVANHLQISPSTLRRWSGEFGDYLSDAAGRPHSPVASQAAHRRYTDQDLETLMTVKGLLTEGLTYIQVGRRLEALRLRQAATDLPADEGNPQVTALTASMPGSAPIFPAVSVLADTLHTVADGQQILLGSQQANRELMSVMLQDSFRLKEENTKLRDRMLELERDLAEIRRQETARRETLEARILRLEDQLQPQKHAPTPAAAAPRAERSGCLGWLLGR